MRIQRLRTGNFGNFKCFSGLYELRINTGPGYRIYCTKTRTGFILILGGGDKGSQQRDIKKCKTFLDDHKKRYL